MKGTIIFVTAQMYKSSLHLRLTHPDPSSLQFRHVPKLFAHFGQRRRFRCFRRSRFDVLPRQRSVRIVGRRGRGSTPSPTLFLGLFWRDPSRPQILPMFSFGHVGTVILVAPQHQTLSQKPQHTLRPQHACHHLFHVVVQQNVSDGTGVRVSIQHGKHLRHLAVNNKKQKTKAKSQKPKAKKQKSTTSRPPSSKQSFAEHSRSWLVAVRSQTWWGRRGFLCIPLGHCPSFSTFSNVPHGGRRRKCHSWVETNVLNNNSGSSKHHHHQPNRKERQRERTEQKEGKKKKNV